MCCKRLRVKRTNRPYESLLLMLSLDDTERREKKNTKCAHFYWIFNYHTWQLTLGCSFSLFFRFNSANAYTGEAEKQKRYGIERTHCKMNWIHLFFLYLLQKSSMSVEHVDDVNDQHFFLLFLHAFFVMWAFQMAVKFAVEKRAAYTRIEHE